MMMTGTSSCGLCNKTFFNSRHLQERLASGRTLHRPSRQQSAIRAEVLPIPKKYSSVKPKGDLVLCKVADAEEKTTGGLLLPSSAQKKPTSGDIVALGDGKVGEEVREFELKVGDTIIYSKFGIGVTDIDVQGVTHSLIREDDVIGVVAHSRATAADIPEIKPVGDRVLLKISTSADVSVGGVLLPESAREKPISGVVVRTGPGKADKEGRKVPKVKAGDQVLYFKWAGDQMETPDGTQYVVVHESDILCKC